MRPGLHVDGEWFGLRYAQAKARSVTLARQYRRPVHVVEWQVGENKSRVLFEAQYVEPAPSKLFDRGDQA